MNVIGYVRVSTQGQTKDGYSLAYQQDEIRFFCQEQGWNLITIYSDEGISGAKVDEEALEVDRIGFQSMLAALTAQTIDAVARNDLPKVKKITRTAKLIIYCSKMKA